VTGVAAALPVITRAERFARVGSTNDIVRGWLADGEPEVCLAVADEQTAGRGRHGRTWTAPPGSALLASLGFRPSWLAPDHAWRLAACVALAMCDAAEAVAALPPGAVRLKWPNDLVIEVAGPDAVELRKLAGVLGESEGLGSDDPRVVVGIGINADWAADDFPAELAASMTSLREASGGRAIDRDALLAAFTERLEGRVEALRGGAFDIATWAGRQATTGRWVAIDDDPVAVRALGVDAASGGLLVADTGDPARERIVHAGEVRRVRLAPGV
jgi:BirA family biotin operon repressor/biotin-[acetyl-CoA-carboxylase] ligase